MNKPIFISIFLLLTCIQVKAQWEMLSDEYTTEVFVHDSTIFFGTNTGDIYASDNFGQNWISIGDSLPDLFIDNIGICEGNKLICSCGPFVYTSANWIDWEKVYEVDGNITSMAIQGDTILIGVEYYGGVHVSYDSGNIWSDVSGTLINRYITSLTFEDSTFLAAIYNEPQVFRFDFLSAEWIPFGVGTESDQIFSLGKGMNYYAGGDNDIFKLEGEEWMPVFYTGAQVSDFDFKSETICAAGKDVYVSSDSGSNWNTIETTYTDSWIKAVALYDGYVMAGNSTGLYRYPLLQVSSSEILIGEEMNIYPNPSKDVMYIMPMIISNENLFINIMNLNGSIIQSSTLIAGDQSIPIDVSRLSSGLYILQIIRGDSMTVKRMIIE
jgi:type IX secretion system substrate protein